MTKVQKWIAGLALGIANSAHGQTDACQLGVQAAKDKNHKAAISHYTVCLRAAVTIPDKARALRNRALSYGELRQYALAIEDQQQALSLEAPTNVWPLVMLSLYYREVKQYERALVALRAATKLDEDGPGTGPGMAVYYHTGQTLHAMGRYQEAIEAYTLGIPRQPDFGYALYRRALSYEALGNREMAKRDLFRAAQLEPRDGYERDVAAKIREYGLAVRKVKPDDPDGGT